MMRRFTLLFVAALSVLSMSAAPVDMEQARKIALSFIKSNYPQTRSGQEALTLVWTDGVTGTRSGSVMRLLPRRLSMCSIVPMLPVLWW
ncbi:hypothetical protein [Parabacteroides sp. AF48-14]|uniref:hypothetical protein n=1 Tax=Parabacteroides sp. AF48-14 TaxID=2292052 RepID=UPI001F3B281E|nr:hypothetical protein [Parabacteroides sp. AF48-14]